MKSDAPGSRDSTRALLDALGDSLLELGASGVLVNAVGDLRGVLHPAKAVPGASIRDAMTKDVADTVLTLVEETLLSGGPGAVEYTVPTADGPHYFEARVAAAPNGNAFVVLRDVHARRAVEERLRESEARFRLMADSAPVMLWKAGTNSECDFFNKRWLEFTGRPLEKELGLGWADGVHVEDFSDCMDTFLAAFVEREPFRIEYRLRRADGAYRWLLDHGVPRFSPSGAFEGYVGSCIDITDLRQAGDEIRALNGRLEERVEEREVLLREIHHRVKNNLQLISSLLGLNARQVEGAARRFMQESQVRVRSIALIHEKLYASRNLADVDLADYARDLVQIVMHAVGANPGISVSVAGDGVRLTVEQASPCGLLINELLTNAVKHAFPDGRSGSIRIRVEHEPGGRVALTVHDDGIGLPPGFDPEKPKSLGFDVVTTLAGQLDADFSFGTGPGATFRLTFPARGPLS